MKRVPTLKELRKYCGDPAKCDYAAYISGVPFVPYTAKLFLWLGWTAEKVNFTWGILGVLSGILYMFGDYYLSLLALLLFHISYVMDGIDGVIARITDKCTIRGVYLDLVNHSMIKSILLLGMGIGAYFNPPSYIPIASYWYLIAGGLASAFIINNNVVRLKMYETFSDTGRIDLLQKMTKERFKTGNPRSLKRTISLFFRLHPLGLFYWATIFNFIPALVLFYGITLPLGFLVRFRKEFVSIKNSIDIPALKKKK